MLTDEQLKQVEDKLFKVIMETPEQDRAALAALTSSLVSLQTIQITDEIMQDDSLYKCSEDYLDGELPICIHTNTLGSSNDK